MMKFNLAYRNNETGNVENKKLVLQGLGFYVETEDGLKNPFFYCPSEVVYKATEEIIAKDCAELIDTDSENYEIRIIRED